MKKMIIKSILLFVAVLGAATAYSQSSVRSQRQTRSQQKTTQSTAQPKTSGQSSAARSIQPQRPVTEENNTSKTETQTTQEQQSPQQPSSSSRRERLQQQQQATTDRSTDLTERARIKNEQNSQEPQHVTWSREIYRIINLDSANNAALKFPTQPVGDRINLFTLIFRLLQENKIAVYNYVADRETDFSDKQRAKFEDILKNNQIPYIVEGTGDNAKYKVEEIDVPSGDVTEYLIKEGWYYDEATGSFKSQIIALCPTIVSIDYNDNSMHKTPFCWIPYENIRPYLQRTMLMTSDYNNAMTYSIDDYFTKRMYDGDIIKTVNMRNLTLAQQVGAEPEALRHAQDSIESQLKGFEKQLWIQPDTTTAVAEKSKKSATKTAKKTAQKSTTSKAEKSTSTGSATRSVRRNK